MKPINRSSATCPLFSKEGNIQVSVPGFLHQTSPPLFGPYYGPILPSRDSNTKPSNTLDLRLGSSERPAYQITQTEAITDLLSLSSDFKITLVVGPRDIFLTFHAALSRRGYWGLRTNIQAPMTFDLYT